MDCVANSHRSKSTLERGATHSASRPVTANQVKAIVELDENKPDPEPVPVVEEPKPVEVKPEEPPVAEVMFCFVEQCFDLCSKTRCKLHVKHVLLAM